MLLLRLAFQGALERLGANCAARKAAALSRGFFNPG
jgi:hypothetical protein